MSDSLRPHGLLHTRFLCPSPTPRACSNSWHWVMPSHHLILCRLRLFLPETVLILKPWSVFSGHQCWYICVVHNRSLHKGTLGNFASDWDLIQFFSSYAQRRLMVQLWTLTHLKFKWWSILFFFIYSGSLYLFTTFSHFPHLHPLPLATTNLFCFYEFDFVRFHVLVRLYSICFSSVCYFI